MSLTLILMRHAKSAWGDPTLDDFDRPLNDRGHRSARAVGKWLTDQGCQPDLVLTSGAKRTIETWEDVAAELPAPAKMITARPLYLSAPETIRAQIVQHSAKTLMVICHNPGIAAFADRIVTAPADHPKFLQFPTAATAIIDFDADTWSDVQWMSGRLRAFVVPRDLTD